LFLGGLLVWNGFILFFLSFPAFGDITSHGWLAHKAYLGVLGAGGAVLDGG
jgi:hypothetical protein